MTTIEKALDPMKSSMVNEVSRSVDRVVLNHTGGAANENLLLLSPFSFRPELASNATWSSGVEHFDTLAIRTGYARSAEGEHSEAIYETSSYVYADSAHSEAAFTGKSSANVYSRFTNPTVRTFEKRLAALEHAEVAVATASGMAALLTTFMTFLRAGDHVICSRSVFGSTTVLLRDYMGKFGVQLSFVPLEDVCAWSAAMRPETRMLLLESPSNPTLAIADIRALSVLADAGGALLVVDNTLCTPCGQNPLALGADLVIHSTGKYIDGQGRCVGGVIAGSAELLSALRGFMRCAGPAMGAHSAWVFLKGLETLQLRMERHSRSALELATWLAGHPRLEQVWYSGLPTHPGHEIAMRQQRLHGGVLSFIIKGDRRAAWRCIDAMRMISRTTNIGDSKTMVTHPASTTHVKLSQEARAAAGIGDNLIRLSVGLEDVHDIVADVEHALTMI